MSVISGIRLFWLLECYTFQIATAFCQDHDDNDNNGSRTENFIFSLFVFKLVSFGCFVWMCRWSSWSFFESCQWNANSPGWRMGLLLCSNSCISVFLFSIPFSLFLIPSHSVSLNICRCSHDAAARRTSWEQVGNRLCIIMMIVCVRASLNSHSLSQVTVQWISPR